MGLSAPTAPYLRPIIGQLSTRAGVGGTVNLPGGATHSFNGGFSRFPNGRRELEFAPGRGNRNLTLSSPPTPLVTNPQEVPLPKKTYLQVGRVTGLNYSAGYLILQGVQMIEDAQLAEEQRIMAMNTVDTHCQIASQTMALAQAQFAACRTAIAQQTKEQRKVRERRTRIHGFSRGGAG
jgi:hypothetical protein